MTMQRLLVDVPVTLTIEVQGDGLDQAEAIEIAKRYAPTIEPSEMETCGYNDVAFEGRTDRLGIVRARIEPDDRRVCKAVATLPEEG